MVVDVAVGSVAEMARDPYSHLDPWLAYTPCNVPGPGCSPEIFRERLSAGCRCAGGCDDGACGCLAARGPNYAPDRTLINHRGPILECNNFCSCAPNLCRNRVVQRGPIYGLEIFDTNSPRGLGLRTLYNVPKGTFICEYAGEVIGKNEAVVRAENQGSASNYIIVVKEHCANGTVVTTRVDPTYVGNIGRYANHSCAPSAAMVPVRSDSPVPRLALFARRHLAAGAEITFDYAGGNRGSKQSSTPCLCGSPACRGFLPHDSGSY